MEARGFLEGRSTLDRKDLQKLDEGGETFKVAEE